MTSQRPLLIVPVLLALGGISAAAQESGRIGVTMEVPTSVGLIWHLSDHVALRPDIALSHSSGTTTPPATTSISSTSANLDATTVTVGVGARLQVAKWDALVAYVSPRVAYARQMNSSTTTITLSVPGTIGLSLSGATSQPVTTTSTFDSVNSIYTASGSFGAQYLLGTRFGVFGEVGLSAGHTNSSTTPSGPGASGSKTTGTTIGTRTAVGLAFYF